mmetsp:Transcript_18013/g.58821  ORF Transcript_18013/g.58821 Transcript_18013/m.58821 type:complete len:228 (-) Transcript_18013:53-736(-)|eukprot:CAMPEP_0170143380 /NCGR_PEP_ID=MMETSP0033_2-20121228/10625_1 /TAXON_ID=195969 /ORGANISM="Dolichomastix tenuilepis, Strain CCMP3274" /LENGTH=227 /DNA_ID=CAMNT_0010379827 /DNA_START=15 /DNA_END=698 /DNA_ORIENTATION=+
MHTALSSRASCVVAGSRSNRLSLRTRQPRQTWSRAAVASSDAAETEEAFEERLAKLARRDKRGAKKPVEEAGAVASSAGFSTATATSAVAAAAAPVTDFSDEEVYFEGPPAAGDLALNIALAITVLWLPLTLASVGRYAWLKYKITNKRICVTSKAPFQDEQTQATYSEVVKVVSVPRGLGFWGDMVVNLRNGDKLEIRSIENFKEVQEYIETRAEEARTAKINAMT